MAQDISTRQEDLCDMKVNKVVKPRPASATSIPGMLFWAQWLRQIVKDIHRQVSVMAGCCSGISRFGLFALPKLASFFILFCKIKTTVGTRTLLQSEWDALMSETYELKTT